MLGVHVTKANMKNSRVYKLVPDERFQEWFEEYGAKKNHAAWDTFDSMKLSRQDSEELAHGNRISRRTARKNARFFPEPNRKSAKPLRPRKICRPIRRRHLLRALNLQEPVFQFHFPSLDSLEKGIWDNF